MHGHFNTLIKSAVKKIVIVGNPNVGKSVIFNHLTGKYVTVSNYPGTTVEISGGFLKGNKDVYVIDSPGVQSLMPRTEDERVTLRILLEENPDIVILVADSKNLKRALVLLYQVSLFKFKTVLVLNMTDEAKLRGIEIDEKKLSNELKIPVVKTVAIHGKGIRELFLNLEKASVPYFSFKPDKKITEIFKKIDKKLEGMIEKKEGIIHLFLARFEDIENLLKSKLKEEDYNYILKIRENFENSLYEPVEFYIISDINKNIEKIVSLVMKKGEVIYKNIVSDLLHNFMIHPVGGFIFIVITLYLLHLFVGVFGAGFLVDLLENKLFGEIINPFLIKLFNLLPVPFLIKALFVGEFGIFTMALTYGFAIIFPVVLTFFIAFGILEDSGYFPRLAFLLNNFFKKIGLSGRAILPLILGLGCDTMATITTRTLETKKEKIIVTLLLALAVPCSAQMGVIFALMSGISFSALIIWGVTIFISMIIVGFFSSQVIRGEKSFFIMEIPPLRIPSLRNIFYKTIARVEWYLKEVIPIFIIGTFLLFILDLSHILNFLEELFRPVVTSLLGLPKESAIGFIMGFLRRDYGAAGFLMLKEKGLLSATQVIVSTVTITLFMPCIANFLVIVKERGLKVAFYISVFVIIYAITAGFLVRMVLAKWPV
ncbi:MAG: ferrous iron transport protein B [candidate division WOR-3 bacterium]